MFHATLLMIPTCFMHIICHIYAFSGTNLLTRCRRASCCFLLFLVSEILVKRYSRKLDETFAQGPIFARSFQKTEEITKWGHEAARGVAGAAQALAALTYPLGPSCGPPR